MARPASKEDLIRLSHENFSKLLELIEELPRNEQEAEFPEGTMNRNIRDVLAHLHHWHLLLLNWYKVGMAGEKPGMPAEGYTWKTSADLNRWIWKEYQATDLVTVKGLVQSSFEAVQDIICRHTDEELFEKRRYHWTGSTSLGSYLVSATSSHYDWAFKLIKKALNRRRIPD